MCPVSDGQPVNAAVTNAAFLDKQIDDAAAGKIGLHNTDFANSGYFALNAQKYLNKIATTIGLVYTSNGSAESDATSNTYSSNNVITNGDTYKVAIGKLDAQFGSGASNNVGFFLKGTDLVSVSGLSWDVSAQFALATPSTGPTVTGVVVSAPDNRVILRQVSGLQADSGFVDASNNIVYGRLTESSGVWTLTFYSENTGIETPYNFGSATDIRIYYQQLFNLNVSSPPYSQLANILENQRPSSGGGGGGSTNGATNSFTQSGGVTFQTCIDGVRRVQTSSTLTHIYINANYSGTSGSTTVQVNYGPTLGSSQTATLAANDGVNTSDTVVSLALTAGDLISVDIIDVADGGPQDITVEVVY